MKRRTLAAVGGLTLLVAAPRLQREGEIHGPDARIAPGGRAYARKMSDDAILVDSLPCGNMFYGPQYRLATGGIESFAWRDARTLVLRTRGLPPRWEDPRRVHQRFENGPFRIVLEPISPPLR